TRSAQLVEPTTSANSTVTSRRSPSAAGDAPSAAPQLKQKRAAPGLTVRQLGQVTASLQSVAGRGRGLDGHPCPRSSAGRATEGCGAEVALPDVTPAGTGGRGGGRHGVGDAAGRPDACAAAYIRHPVRRREPPPTAASPPP